MLTPLLLGLFQTRITTFDFSAAYKQYSGNECKSLHWSSAPLTPWSHTTNGDFEEELLGLASGNHTAHNALAQDAPSLRKRGHQQCVWAKDSQTKSLKCSPPLSSFWKNAQWHLPLTWCPCTTLTTTPACRLRSTYVLLTFLMFHLHFTGTMHQLDNWNGMNPPKQLNIKRAQLPSTMILGWHHGSQFLRREY